MPFGQNATAGKAHPASPKLLNPRIRYGIFAAVTGRASDGGGGVWIRHGRVGRLLQHRRVVRASPLFSRGTRGRQETSRPETRVTCRRQHEEPGSSRGVNLRALGKLTVKLGFRHAADCGVLRRIVESSVQQQVYELDLNSCNESRLKDVVGTLELDENEVRHWRSTCVQVLEGPQGRRVQLIETCR